MKQRWLPVGLLGLAIFVVNAVARFISWKASVEDADAQSRLGLIGVIAVGLLVMGAGAWWAVRYPFPRLVGDLVVGIGIGTLLSVLIGPFAGGQRPFTESVEFFVYEILLLFAIGAVGGLLGFVVVTALGRDWKSRGLKRYEQRYARPGTSRRPRATRG